MLCSRVPLYQPMYSTIARRAPARVGQAWLSVSSPFREEKKLSARALSQHWPLRAERQHDLAVPGEPGELRRGVLAAAVGVEDHAVGRGGDGVAHRVADELGAHVLGHRVAHHAAGGYVDHGGQEQPSFPGAQVSDVTAPAGVQLGGSAVKSRRIRSARAAVAEYDVAKTRTIPGLRSG